jgi:osmotically-inducible protein OsmY
MNTSINPRTSIPEGLLASAIHVPAGVSVINHDGHLTLEGAVKWNYERVQIERTVRRVRGVRSIFNNILVKPVF